MKILERSRPPVSLLDFSTDKIKKFIQNKLTKYKIIEAYLFGSLVQENASAWSDIDLLIVQSTTTPFLERARTFDELYELGIPIDVLVYTPEEFNQLKESDSGFWKNFKDNHLRII